MSFVLGSWSYFIDVITRGLFFAGTLEAVKRMCPKQAMLIGMGHEFDHHHMNNEFLDEWS